MKLVDAFMGSTSGIFKVEQIGEAGGGSWDIAISLPTKVLYSVTPREGKMTHNPYLLLNYLYLSSLQVAK